MDATDIGSDDIVRVGTASSVPEAYAWRQALQDEGINCKVVGEYLGVGGFGTIAAGNIAPEVWVHASDIDRARSILKDWLDRS